VPASTLAKGPEAFRTIGEVAAELGIAQHILRYWESKFPQLKPLQRAGNRRYYRPEDVALLRQIQQLLSQKGYTIRGVQQLLRSEAGKSGDTVAASPADVVDALKRIRSDLSAAIDD
jgi:DNA-binding transcriptional MerR regulator